MKPLAPCFRYLAGLPIAQGAARSRRSPH